MKDVVGFVEYDRLFVVEKIKSSLSELEEDKLRRIAQYEQDVIVYNALPFYKRWFMNDPKESKGFYRTALDWYTSYQDNRIYDLTEQLEAFELSESPKVYLSSDSWLISWIK